MKLSIQSTRDLGTAIRAVRKSAALRQDDLAGVVGVSRQFAVDVEKGKPTVQLGRVLLLLQELGIPLSVDVPDDAAELYFKIQSRQKFFDEIIERTTKRLNHKDVEE